ncbi:MAG: hypothetical protein AAF927_31175 [Bacteroidota bacterium]
MAEFLSSPYHNKQKVLGRLFALICQASPDFTPQQLVAEKIWQSLYPKQSYEQQKLKDHMSQLSRLLKGFLLLQYLQEEADGLAERLSLASLAGLQAEKLFGQYRNAWQKTREKAPYRDANYYEDWMHVADYTDQLKGISWKREYGHSLQAKADNLDRYYLIQKLQAYCEMLNRNNLQQQHYEPHLIEDIQALLQNNPQYLAVPAIKLWYLVLQTLLKSEDRESFLALREALQEDGHYFRSAERRAMYKYALNFCIRRINAGQNQYLEDSFTIYQEMLAARLLHVQGKLSHTDYKNIASSGIRLQAFDWVENFIHQYKSEVGGGLADNVYTYCLAYLYAASGKEGEAMRLLQEVQFTDVYYVLSARTLLLQIFYDQGEWDSLEYQLKAYQLFLKRNRTISQRNRKLYLNYARYLGLLLKYRDQSILLDKASRNQKHTKLVSDLQGQSELAHKSWLMERLAALGK